ncbi:MAG: asparagine synthase-related protein, partial [Pseudomonadota bacterium]
TDLARRVLNAEVLKTYPATLCAMGEHTFFRDIRSVCAAHSVTFVADPQTAPTVKRYWRLPLGPLLSAKSDPDEIATELHRLLDQAVRRRLPASGSGAGHLSGGLDSTAIGILASRALGEQQRAFDAFCYREERQDPDLEVLDEWTYASAVAQREPNVRLHGVGTPGEMALLGEVDPTLFFSTHPNEPEEQVLRQVADSGSSIILSGWGGDEVVTWRGSENLAELFWSGQWDTLSASLDERSRNGGSSQAAIFRKAVLSQSLPNGLRNLVRRRHGSTDDGWIELIAAMVPADHRDAVRSVPGREEDRDSRVERRNCLEHWSIPEKLEAFAQRGARHGVAYAFPMLDLDLMAYAVRIPAILLRDETHDRALFRRAMEDVLPDMVRMKTDKLLPFPVETLRHAEQKDELVREVHRMAENPVVRRFVDTNGLIDYIERIRNPDQIRAWMNDAATRGEQVSPYELYHLMALRLANFLDRHGAVVE